MKRTGTLFLTAFVFILGCAVGGSVSRFAVPPSQAKDVQRWDYFCFREHGADAIMAKAKAAGRDGWEMVMADSLQMSQSICFKRPL
jgi:hypothetical protein